MPFSYDKSREFMCEEIVKSISKKLNKNCKYKILDCGVGAGLVAKNLAENLSTKFENIELIGLEIFQPYITNPKIMNAPIFHAFYEKIIIANFQEWLSIAQDKTIDTIIFGDSIEHLNPEWAEDSLANAIRVAKDFVYISTTIGEFKQEPVFGNEFERHCIYWEKSQYEQFGAQVLWYEETSATAVYRFDVKKHKKLKIPIPQTREMQKNLGCHMFDKYGKEMIL